MIMSQRALGMIELKSIAVGYQIADTVAKTADVELIYARPICPGKFSILFRGGIAAVGASLERGIQQGGDVVNDSFLLGNPDEQVYNAVNGKLPKEPVAAMGVIETWAVPAALVAADQGVKAAETKVVRVGLARELGGKAFVIFTGEVAAVEAALSAAAKDSRVAEKLIEKVVIPNPDPALWDSII